MSHGIHSGGGHEGLAHDQLPDALGASGGVKVEVVAAAGATAAGSVAVEVAVGAGSQQLLAANAARRGVVVHNGTDRRMWLKEGANASDVSFTAIAAPGATWEPCAPVYTGRIDVYFERPPLGSVWVTERS